MSTMTPAQIQQKLNDLRTKKAQIDADISAMAASVNRKKRTSWCGNCFIGPPLRESVPAPGGAGRGRMRACTIARTAP